MPVPIATVIAPTERARPAVSQCSIRVPQGEVPGSEGADDVPVAATDVGRGVCSGWAETRVVTANVRTKATSAAIETRREGTGRARP